MIHFLESQSKIPGYSSPFRLDRDQKGRGIVVFVREDITANKSLSFEDKPIEAHIELNFLAVRIILTKKHLKPFTMIKRLSVKAGMRNRGIHLGL